MTRAIHITKRTTRDGPAHYLSLYDDHGRYVLTARIFDFEHRAGLLEEITAYLDRGHLTAFAQHAVRTRQDT